MSRRSRSGRFRTATALVAAGLVLGTGLAVAGGSAAADPSTKYLGVFRETSPTEVPAGTVGSYGVAPASVQWFDSWATGRAFNATAARTLWDQGIMTHYTWEPWNTALGVADPEQIHLQDILDGKWDSYIRARGAEFASVGAPIMVRWGHEFNGNWYPWGIVNNGSDPALYVNAYRRVHDLVVAAGATNVQWVWCFNNGSTPDSAFNEPARSYPGDAYVDWVAIDGYNWGLAPSWDPAGNYWTSFEAAYSSAYAKARSIAPKRPVMIAEIASSEDGGDKAQWINDLSAALDSGRYPDLKLVNYFDQDKEELWSGTSSAAAKAAFTSWVNQPYMRGKGVDLAKVAAEYKGPTTTTTTTTPPGACSATYRTVGSWSGGFQGEVTIVAGASGTKGWTARWTTATGQTIKQVWNGALSVSGSAVSVKNLSWNGTLSPNGTTRFGFLAGGSPTTPSVTCDSP
ncbi:glycosyl hydrolase family 26 [Saccharothrix carnea]|uniref:Glycosyl hydrolase family 26 n=1 Tax=Saccharothrix carnea TaxID=1280637 RepID=A0A2P8I115_SACCR|nr:cellulose binding domain-containing protein [Saccharothrix carnea]PSL52155.1 glycosyl hydrolase family 26 [Saccharothrix carnea]